MRTNFERYHTEDKSSLKDKFKDGINLRFTVTRLLILFGVGIMLLIWAFFIGILVGRGERPEEKIPEIAKMMPREAVLAENSTSKNASKANGAAGGARLNSTDVINIEDLGFMHTLKTKPTRDDLTKAPLPTNIPSKKKPKKVDEKAAVADTNNLVVARKSGKNVFNYQYQVAESNDKASAQKLKDKLRKKGMSPSVQTVKEDGKTVYRVVLAFKGAPEDTRKLREALRQEGIDKVIMRSKIAAP